MMKKQVWVITPSCKEDESIVFDCDEDSTADEIYAAVLVLYPDWIKMEIVIDKR